MLGCWWLVVRIHELYQPPEWLCGKPRACVGSGLGGACRCQGLERGFRGCGWMDSGSKEGRGEAG